jgi:hypothetical protein
MAQPTAVIQVEGVLRKPVTGAPIDTGRRLYHGLASTFRIVLVSDGDDREYLGHWLGMENFGKHDHIVYSGDWRPRHEEQWVATAGVLKLQFGYDTELFIVPDPHDAAALIRHGYNALLFVQASYALPEWRPDHRQGVQPWEELMGEIAAQRTLRATDKRMDGGIL